MWHAPARQTGAETEIINDSYVISFSSRAVPKLVPGVGVGRGGGGGGHDGKRCWLHMCGPRQSSERFHQPEHRDPAAAARCPLLRRVAIKR